MTATSTSALFPDGPLIRRMVRIMRRLQHHLSAPAFPRPMSTPFRLRTGTRHPADQYAVHRMPSLAQGGAGLLPFPCLVQDERHVDHRSRTQGEIA